MNPCSCGNYPDRNKCNCSLNQVKKYLGKISRPLLERIDICVETLSVNFKDLEKKKSEESSKEIKKRVMLARNIQMERYKNEDFYFNSQLSPRKINQYCKLGNKEQDLLEKAYQKMNLSARAYHRILKVSRTIADLDNSENITAKHLSEAICYRSLDRKYWEQ
jgi:magnesium chelatase family protein